MIINFKPDFDFTFVPLEEFKDIPKVCQGVEAVKRLVK